MNITDTTMTNRERELEAELQRVRSSHAVLEARLASMQVRLEALEQRRIAPESAARAGVGVKSA